MPSFSLPGDHSELRDVKVQFRQQPNLTDRATYSQSEPRESIDVAKYWKMKSVGVPVAAVM